MPFPIQSQQSSGTPPIARPKWFRVNNCVFFHKAFHFFARVCLFICQWIMAWHLGGHKKSHHLNYRAIKMFRISIGFNQFRANKSFIFVPFSLHRFQGFWINFFARIYRSQWNMHVYHDACCVNWLKCIVLCSITMSLFCRFQIENNNEIFAMDFSN